MAPLVSAAKNVASSKSLMITQEARAFDSKLRTLIETRICKSKLRCKEKSQGSEFGFELPADLIELLKSCARSSIPSLQQLATSCILSLVRICSVTQSSSMIAPVATLLKGLSLDFFSKKKGLSNSKLFDEVILRYQDLAAVALSESLVSGMMHGASPFLKTEAFRLLSSILKKRKSLLSSGTNAIVSNLEPSIQAVASILSDKDIKEARSFKPKHYEAIIACAKDMAQFISESQEIEGCSKIASQLHAVMKKGGKSDLKDSLKKIAESVAHQLDPFKSDGSLLQGDQHKKKRKVSSAEVKESAKRKSKGDKL